MFAGSIVRTRIDLPQREVQVKAEPADAGDHRARRVRTVKICYLRFVRLGKTVGYTDTLDLANHMAKMGHKVFFIVLGSERNEEWAKAFYKRVFFLRVPPVCSNYEGRIGKLINLVSYTLFSLLFLVRLHLKEKIDFIHFYPETAITVFIFSRIFGNVQTILDLRKPTLIQAVEIGLGRTFVHLTVAFYTLSEKLSIILSDAMIAVSNGVKSYIKDRIRQYRVGEEKEIMVIPSMVDLDMFRPTRDRMLIRALKAKNGLEPDEKILIYVGSASKVRDFHRILMALSKILARGYKVRLVILGVLDQELFSLLESLSLEDHLPIRYVHHPFVPSYIEMADVCLSYLPDIATYRYSSPLKVLEYMAMEKPVVATDISAHRELIQNEATGILTECNENDFAEGIMYLLDNLHRSERMGKRARRFAERNFSVKVVGPKYEAFLKRVCENKLCAEQRNLTDPVGPL